MNTLDNAMMDAALRQASTRSEREGKICQIWKGERSSVWYVRTPDEGVPENATLVASVFPDGKVNYSLGF